MNLNGLSLFKLMGDKLGWLSARQTVLSQNVANADTPGYQPKDLSPFSFKGQLQLAKPLPLAVSNPQHLPGAAGNTGSTRVGKGEVYETRPDMNAVSMEDQLTKVAETGADYQAITNLYRKQLSMMKVALGRGGSA